MKNKKNDNNESMSFIEKLIILIKGFFTKITPKKNDFSDKSLEKVETWKKKQSPGIMRYTEKILKLIKKIKDLLGPSTVKIFKHTKKILVNIKNTIPVLGKIYTYIAKFLNNLFTKCRHYLKKTYLFFQVLFSPVVWLINFIWSLRILRRGIMRIEEDFNQRFEAHF